MKRSLTVEFPDDANAPVEVQFLGMWTGREVEIAITNIIRGYKRRVRELIKKEATYANTRGIEGDGRSKETAGRGKEEAGREGRIVVELEGGS